MVVILFERGEFSFKILRIPKEDVVKVFAANRSDQPFNEGMRYQCICDGLNFINPKNP